jgi:hypothetical protein
MGIEQLKRSARSKWTSNSKSINQAGMNQVQQGLSSNGRLGNRETRATGARVVSELYEVFGKNPDLKSRSTDSLLTLPTPVSQIN